MVRLTAFLCFIKVAASVFFYGWWSTTYIPLLLASIVFNYTVGYIIAKNHERARAKSKAALYVGVISNLLLLCYYKYSNFFLGEVARSTGVHMPTLELVLPLGISFFTFTQIAFLVDAWKGKAQEYNFWHYLLFVTWFPHLIAGPILHHGQMMPQFKDPEIYRIRSRNISIGVALFAVGLGKKLLLADPISTYADPVFHAAATGQAIGPMIAWVGAIAYTLQIYFDFSGYSDMAVGLSMLFGIHLPINFNSPYKARNIIEFWRRWHMTLSQFLRDYLYIPLGGNRKGETRRLVNLMLTMLLGGLWHGANWTFVIWGALHGAYLCINHMFQKIPPPPKDVRVASCSDYNSGECLANVLRGCHRMGILPRREHPFSPNYNCRNGGFRRASCVGGHIQNDKLSAIARLLFNINADYLGISKRL
ncbi:D-alanyl-lipoteichoic acid acyltransferase DltB, MBOAT superfamily [Pseudomonas mandelii]|uniref:Probable alginate O-acetylase n=1 Tax=Pseudomonas mandelii TaxID=75612 RepID=A0ABY0VEM8_9PSED|nr:D-alanyl-lipoteichoic acid acyltransferase DltB, MBOAT superfamily [Pseudomonas mandelii]